MAVAPDANNVATQCRVALPQDCSAAATVAAATLPLPLPLLPIGLPKATNQLQPCLVIGCSTLP